MNQLKMTGLLGEEILIGFETDAERLQKQREWGAQGFTTGEPPRGGYVLPLCMADTFDWALIGARKWKTPEGEDVILHRGHSYKVRHMEAVESKKMTLPACVKVSRGAKPSDPDHLREKSDGEIEYVTLAIFRGGGKALEGYEVPRSSQPRSQKQQQAPTKAPEPEQPRQSFRDAWMEAAGGTEFDTPAGRDEVAAAVAGVMGLDIKTFKEALDLRRADVNHALIVTAKAWLAESQQASD